MFVLFFFFVRILNSAGANSEEIRVLMYFEVLQLVSRDDVIVFR